jgi:diguanylate cyclase (GGDEF)-like protein
MSKKTNSKNRSSVVVTRSKQAIAITIFCLGILLLSTLILNFSPTTLAVLGLDFFILSLLLLVIKENNLDKSVMIYFWVNLFVASYLLLITGGINSSFNLVFPSFLMACAAMTSTKNYISVFAFVMIVNIGVGIATSNGWIIAAQAEFSYWQVIVTTIFMSTAGYTAWRFNGDMKFAIRKMKSEAQNSNNSRKEIERLIHFDPLTGLSSKMDSETQYQSLKEKTYTTLDEITFIYLDLDNFKAINDYYGHAMGDEVLKSVATRLKNLIEEKDVACRLSGDEFLIIISRAAGFQIENFVIKILQQVSKPIEINDYLIDTTLSMGAVTQYHPSITFERAVKCADHAMYHAKQLGKNQFAIYNNSILKDSSRQLDIINGLKLALKNNDLELYFQPKVSGTTGKINCAEALIRWTRNNPNNYSPAEFIPVIESTELICNIGEWVINNACKLCKELQDKGWKGFTISVNISATQFAKGGLAQIIKRELTNANLAPHSLELELTEHTLFQDNEIVLNELSLIRDLGVTLSIDDFGTGYSNLGYLTKLKVNYLKIDRSFITNIHEKPKNRAIVHAILKMARALGVKVVAEGVETEKEWAILQKLRCDYGQGFLWSKPVPIEQFTELAPIYK